jgi:hypothetical protein
MSLTSNIAFIIVDLFYFLLDFSHQNLFNNIIITILIYFLGLFFFSPLSTLLMYNSFYNF